MSQFFKFSLRSYFSLFLGISGACSPFFLLHYPWSRLDFALNVICSQFLALDRAHAFSINICPLQFSPLEALTVEIVSCLSTLILESASHFGENRNPATRRVGVFQDRFHSFETFLVVAMTQASIIEREHSLAWWKTFMLMFVFRSKPFLWPTSRPATFPLVPLFSYCITLGVV